MVQLRVNHSGSKLVIDGPKTGRKYRYDPASGKDRLSVEDADVSDFLNITYTQGCGCKKNGDGSVVSVKLFERL